MLKRVKQSRAWLQGTGVEVTVAVGGTGVFVGGTGVLVGGTGVLVAVAGIFVGEAVGDGAISFPGSVEG